MQKIKLLFKLIFSIVMFGIAIISIEDEMLELSLNIENAKTKITDEEFRSKFYSEEQLRKLQGYSEVCKKILKHVEKDMVYYPIPESTVDKSLTTDFANSWMNERTFGGKRGHEGVDIMAATNQRGLYPVVSMTDGVVTNLGWIEKGGYRVGITSDSGIYYYYAHLESFSNINEGQRIKAGDFLGYMGDSGYGPEGTTGKFAVHLHVGIYTYIDGKEVSLNPYYILCKLENKKLKYTYS